MTNYRNRRNRHQLSSDRLLCVADQASVDQSDLGSSLVDSLTHAAEESRVSDVRLVFPNTRLLREPRFFTANRMVATAVNYRESLPPVSRL